MQRYRLRSDDVTHEIFDGELVIVDLETGAYYSANQSASVIWQCLLAGLDVERTAERVAERYAVTPASIEDAVGSFVVLLRTERLLVETEDASPGAPPVFDTPAAGSFVTPKLDRYDDLQELLLLDPVHDVDATGWPAANVPGATH